MKTKTTVTVEVTDDQIRSLLCNAFEGGSNYWYSEAEPVLPSDGSVQMADVSEGGALQPRNPDGTQNYFHWAQLLPTLPGCAVRLRAHGAGKTPDDVYTLDREALNRGVQIMATKYVSSFADWMTEHDDATTGDVFLQCCLFGELVFG